MIGNRLQDDVLIISPEGRIDTNNAEETKAEIWDVLGQNEHKSVVLDMGGLDYISSAGLRVVLKLIKEEKGVKAVNVKSEVYEILEMTGFTELFSVQKAYRSMSIEGCKVIGRGAKGTVYRYDPETVIKVYLDPDSLPDIQNERKMARMAFVLGIPTAISYDIVTVDGCYGSVFELLDAKSYSELIAEEPENTGKYAEGFAKLLRTIHTTGVDRKKMPDVKNLVFKWLRETEQFFPDETAEKLKALVKETPDRDTMIHGDYHTNNLMVQNGETLLIDMDTLACGHPVFELANVYAGLIGLTGVDPETQEDFFGYSRETMAEVWKDFLPAYLGTDDEEAVAKVAAKVELIGNLRCLRHVARRVKNNEKYADAVKVFSGKIIELADSISELDF